jgi:hypothetical protein
MNSEGVTGESEVVVVIVCLAGLAARCRRRHTRPSDSGQLITPCRGTRYPYYLFERKSAVTNKPAKSS